MSKANSSKYIWQHAVKRGALAVNIRAIPFILSTAMILPLINVKVMAATPLAYAVPIKSLPHTGLPSTPFYQSELPTLEHSASQGTVRNVTILVDTPRRAALLQNYARAVSTPTSPLYHHFLTPQKLAQEFGPSPKAFAQVMQAVSDAGWRIIHRTALTLSAEIPAHRSTLKIPVARDLYAIDGLSPVHIITPHATLAKAWTHSPGHLVTVRSETSTSNLTSYDFSQPPTQVESVTASNGDSITVMSFNPAIRSDIPAGLPFNLIVSAQSPTGQPLAIQSIANIADTLNNIGSYGNGQAFPGSNNTLWQLELAGFSATNQVDTLSATVTLADGTIQNISFPLPTFSGPATALFPLTGSQVSQLLGAQTLYQKALQTPPAPVAILTVGDAPSLSDLSTLMAQESLPVPSVSFPNTGSGSSTTTSGSSPSAVEPNLDLQAVASVAPGAPIADYVYSANDPADPLTSFLALLAQNGAPKIATISYGFYGENAATLSTLMNACTAEGITLVFASGDEGAYASSSGMSLGTPDADNQPDALTVGGLNLAAAATTNNTGTMTNLSGPVVLKAWGGDYLNGLPLPILQAYLAENNASTGGFGSTPIPSWQTPVLPANAPGLGIPDIASMAGFPSFQGVIDGSVVGLGGTSLAAPLTAGWLDDLETADGIQHIGLGNINPLLFNAAQDHPQDFMQALWGSNGYYSVTSSTPGSWNPVTGLGAPNWDQLAQVWDPQSTSASQLQWTHVPSQAVAGIQQMWTLKVLNGQGNLVSTFANTVTLTSSDTHAHFPAQITFTNGQAQVPVTFESPGTQSLTAFGPHGANIQPATASLSVVPAPTISTSSNPVVGHPITVTVGFSSSSAALSYQFWIRNPQTGLWSAPQGGFSSRNTLHFTPVVPGRYDLIVYIQGLGSSPVTFSDTINVLASKNTPMVSALHLSGPSAFASRGQSLTLTAQATDANGTPLYQFWLLAPNKGWEMVQNYSPQNTWTISNLQPGSYVIAVYALDGQQFAQHDFWQAFDATTVINVDSHVNLTISSTNPVALDAHASGISNPVYQFWIQSPNGQWHASGAYGAGTDLFQPNGSGTYTIVVYAKDLYAPATSAFAVSTSMTFTVPAN